MIITSKKKKGNGRKTPREIKGLVVKWKRALVTPFRNATTSEADPLQLVAMIFTGEKHNMTCEP